MPVGPALTQMMADILTARREYKGRVEPDPKAPRRFVIVTRIVKGEDGHYHVEPSEKLMQTVLHTKQELLDLGYNYDEIANKPLVRLVDGVEYY